MLIFRSRVITYVHPQRTISTLPRVWRCFGKRRISTSGSTGTGTNEKLPLAGIRVLDMTRVLAGVSHRYITNNFDTGADSL
jgi:hypothetical protein